MKRFTHKQRSLRWPSRPSWWRAAASIAFAYFTARGAARVRPQVGTGPGDAFTLTSSGPDTPLTPGGGAQQFDVSIQNTSVESAYIGEVSMSVLSNSVTGDAETPGGDDIVGCAASWFTVSPSMVVNTNVGAGDTVTASGLGLDLPSISMSESGTDQDACEGSTIGIAFSA